MTQQIGIIAQLSLLTMVLASTAMARTPGCGTSRNQPSKGDIWPCKEYISGNGSCRLMTTIPTGGTCVSSLRTYSTSTSKAVAALYHHQRAKTVNVQFDSRLCARPSADRACGCSIGNFKATRRGTANCKERKSITTPKLATTNPSFRFTRHHSRVANPLAAKFQPAPLPDLDHYLIAVATLHCTITQRGTPQNTHHRSNPARKPHASGTHSTDTARNSQRETRHPLPAGPAIMINWWSMTDTRWGRGGRRQGREGKGRGGMGARPCVNVIVNVNNLLAISGVCTPDHQGRRLINSMHGQTVAVLLIHDFDMSTQAWGITDV